MRNIIGTRNLHSKVVVQSCVTPPYIQVQGLCMIDLAMKTSCSYNFSHCASLHLPSFDFCSRCKLSCACKAESVNCSFVAPAEIYHAVCFGDGQVMADKLTV